MVGGVGMRLDEIGYWSETKLDIVREYAAAYSTVLSAQRNPALTHIYIDAFAGAGVHLSRERGEPVTGSPLQALEVEPPFREYHFIDLAADKVEHLRFLVREAARPGVHIYHGDCNEVLLRDVFPRAQYEDFRRGLCLLDPYGLHLDWGIFETAGRMRSIEIFLNFPTMDINMNVLLADPARIKPAQARRMTRFWGDESWRQAAYRSQPTLFGDEEVKQSNDALAAAFQERLRRAAGFAHVPDPVPMRNRHDATLYYLFFASQKPVAARIVDDIFNKHAASRGRRWLADRQ